MKGEIRKTYGFLKEAKIIGRFLKAFINQIFDSVRNKKTFFDHNQAQKDS